MFVSATTECYPDLPLGQALERLADQEYTRIEISLREDGQQLRPSQVLANLEQAVLACRETHRLKPVAYTFESNAPEPLYYEQFAACCKLAKATKVVQITVPAGELGTPFNAEVERLRELVRIASPDGVVVGLRSQLGRISQDPDTAEVLCENVKGLGVTLDPSVFLCGPHHSGYDKLLKHTVHVYLRDTSKDKFQVRVGQGAIEFGRLVTQLTKMHYHGALSVFITPQADVDHGVEMRKLRLLLESLL